MFSAYLATLKSQPDLIFVSEIWVYSHEISGYKLGDYNFKACCNDSYRSGGVGVYIHSNFPKTSVRYCNWPSADVLIMNTKLGNDDWVFICIYRFYNKPISAFCNDLEDLLLTTKEDNVVILGDMNINLLDSDECFGYQTMLASLGFLSLVNDPTRNRTCLDHIFVKVTNRYRFSVDKLSAFITDHDLIKLDLLSSPLRVASVSSVKSKSYVDYTKLRAYLLHENWDSVYEKKNCNSAFSSFIDILKLHVDASKYAPTNRCLKKLKPWMNAKVLNKIHKLKKFARKLNHHPNNTRLRNYVKKLSTNVNTSIKEVKNLYYKTKFNNVGKNSKQTWKVIDEVLGRSSEKMQISEIYQFNSNTLITDPLLIADEFNRFFIKVSSDLSSKFGQSTVGFNRDESHKFIFGSVNNYPMSAFFEPITSLEIISEIRKLKNKNSKGIDDVDNFIVKHCSWYIVDVLN